MEHKYKYVYKTKSGNGNKTYFIARIHLNSKSISIPGYYYTQLEAAIAREHYIIIHNINTKRNKIVIGNKELSDKDILKEYSKLEELKKNRKLESIRKTRIKRNNRYGIYSCKDNSNIAIVNGKVVCRVRDLKACKCIRNIYITDNNIDNDILYDVGMSLDNQREYVKEYWNSIRVKQSKIEVRKGSKYRGVSIGKTPKGTKYIAMCRVRGKRVFIGESSERIEAAMMYNIYMVKNNIVQERVNDTGLKDIEEEIDYLRKVGFYITEEFKFRKRKI